MKNCPTCQSSYPLTFAVCPQDGTPLVEVGAWTPGAVVRGKYRIVSKVGQGGFGAVYKALHVQFEELRAIKVINKEYLSDQLFVKRFKHEAVITRKLQHPNAVRVDDIDESEDGIPFIVMEFIEGQSLRKLIETEGAQPPARVCSVIKQSAAALEASHRLGMVHRDIKPDNIVLVPTPEGEMAKVLDFGIAKVKEGRKGDTGGMTLTGTGVVIGTPQYMSPEQAMGKRGDQLDGRSDLYSLGIVMYQMLTGELPFKADTTMEMLIAHVQQPPVDVAAVHPELQIPEAVASVAMRLLEKNPDDRPASAQDLINEIEAAEAAISGEMGATHVMSAVDLEEQPINIPPPPPPIPPRTPARTSRVTAPQPGGGSGASLRTVTPPPVPSRAVTPPRPVAPAPVPAPQVRVMPPQVIPAKKPSQAGIWAALGILVVILGGGAWYFTEHRATTENVEPVPAPAPSPGPVVPKPSDASGTNPLDGGSTGTGGEAATDGTHPLDTGGGSTTGRPDDSSRRRTQDFVQPKPAVVTPKPQPAPPPPKATVDTKRVNAALKMGQFYFDRGEYEKAIEEFEQGLALDPSNSELRSSVARAKKAKQAEDLLNQ
jgi:eukaryotic-like serine/threonine-protein kinase